LKLRPISSFLGSSPPDSAGKSQNEDHLLLSAFCLLLSAFD
jgi:hypothetical protein